MKYVNTALAIGMLSDGNMNLTTLTQNEVIVWLDEHFNQAVNACNPNHANTLNGLTRVLGYDLQGTANGERFCMIPGDECLVFGLVPPLGYGRETREFTDEEISACKISYRLVKMT